MMKMPIRNSLFALAIAAVGIPFLAFDSPALDDEVPFFREKGYEGMETFLRKHQFDLQDPQSPNFIATYKALDAIAGQKDAYYSKLYWHTDLEAAKEQAQKLRKPILSLRLLGRLTDDMSCANSRLFRVALYPDPDIAEYLRQNYVLHWSTEREVPSVTIDFGNGKVMRRTVTGNSAHYVLNAYGQPLDVIPGLYSPQYFLKLLQDDKRLHDELLALKPDQRAAFLANWHQDAATRISSIAANQGIELSENGVALSQNQSLREALAVQQLTVSKAMIERPLLSMMEVDNPNPWNALGSPDPWQDRWQNLARFLLVSSRLSDPSLQLVQVLAPEKYPSLQEVETTKSALEMQMYRETAQNEAMMHFQIHSWFAGDQPQTHAFATLNEAIYTQLFRTPASDEWLGMDQLDVFTGLEHDGIQIKN